MSVRKIPKNHIHVTGRHAAQKSDEVADFESLLESDHLLLLDHDLLVKRYETQPVRIPVPRVPPGYVPDVLVEFHPDADGVPNVPELREVKPEAVLVRDQAKFAPKFEAAKRYCDQQNWVFKIVTERDIRTPRLANVKFLRGFESQQHPQELMDRVLKLMATFGRSDSKQILDAITLNPEEQLHWMPVLWHLVSKRQVTVDWDVAFGPVVPLFAVKD